MKSDIVKILDLYIKGKDEDQYKILESIYSEKGAVEFEINSKDISFPQNIIGNKNIAKILSKDFNEKYSKVKTYYLKEPKDSQLHLNKQPWLVVMLDKSSGLTRVGTGYYNWDFIYDDKELKILNHKIYIHSMLEVQDTFLAKLNRIQSTLNYPWVEQRSAVQALIKNPDFKEIVEYLK